MKTLDLIFLLAASQILYTYFGYPLLIAVLARLFPCSEIRSEQSMQRLPSVSVVMIVYNEAQRVASKLRNLNALDYPAGQLEIVVVSDGSTDETVKIAREFEGVKVIARRERSGKAACLKTGVASATGELILFMDVRQEIEAGSVKAMVERLADPDIAAVGGELVHRNALTNQGENVGLYWRYEKFIRKMESRFKSTVGVSGALYMIRRHDFPSISDSAILDDFEIPMLLTRDGRRAVLEPRAIAYDTVQENMEIEAKRKLRTLKGNFQALKHQPWLLNPLRNPLFFQYLSHKFFRLLVPWSMIVVLVVTLIGAFDGRLVYQLLFGGQVLFYGLAVAARSFPRLRESKLPGVAYVFTEMNWTTLQACLQYFAQPVDPRWDKT